MKKVLPSVKIRCNGKVKETHDYLVSLGYEPFHDYDYITNEYKVYSWFGWETGDIHWDNKQEYFDEDCPEFEEVFLPSENAPPIGLRPKAIVDALRIKEILEAMTRYAEGGQKIPQEWVDELSIINSEQA